MKTKNLLGIFFLFLCTITLVSCGDDEKQEIYSLSFEKGYYERPLLGAKNIPVRGGNRDYTVTVQNTDVLSINIDLSSPIGMGNLVVKPKQKGETTVTVKDNVTNETVNLKIKIVDSYLNLKVAHPAQVPYSGGENLFFINNSDRDFYLFDEKMEKKECTHESQNARPPCPSPTPGVHSNSCPSSHPAISSSVIPFSSCQSLPASESFPMSQLLT